MTKRKIFVLQAVLMAVVFPAIAWAADFKNQITFPADAYCSQPSSAGDSAWAKFTIKLNDLNTVYFQDSNLYVLHHEFATSVLDPFIGISSSDFYQVTLYQAGQQAALGTVIIVL